MEYLLILGVLGILGGVLLGVLYVRSRTNTSQHKDLVINDQKATIEHLKKEVQVWQGKTGYLKSKTKEIEITTDPKDDPRAAIFELVNSVKDTADPRFQKLLNNPKAMNFLINVGYGLYKKYPGQTEEFIAAFMPQITKFTGIGGSGKNNSESPGLQKQTVRRL